MDNINLYQVHANDSVTPVEETLFDFPIVDKVAHLVSALSSQPLAPAHASP
jgi:hypothetical protein